MSLENEVVTYYDDLASRYDTSKEMIGTARQKHPHQTLIKADAAHAPFDYLDLVCSSTRTSKRLRNSSVKHGGY